MQDQRLRRPEDPFAWVCSHACGSGLSAQSSPRAMCL